MSATETFLVKEAPMQGGVQRVYRLPNGYGASVVRHTYSYGSAEGLWELAVALYEGEGVANWGICYDTPITDDVLGYLSDEDVADALARIAALPEATS